MPWTPLTEALIPNVAERVKAGNWPEIAAKGLGVRPQDWTAWAELGEQLSAVLCAAPDTNPVDDLTSHEHLCATLVRAVDQAEAECEGALITKWLTAGATGRGNSWNAFATYLERRYPERWSKRPAKASERDTRSLEDMLDSIDREDN